MKQHRISALTLLFLALIALPAAAAESGEVIFLVGKGTVTEGAVACVATAQHLGRSTQVWDAVVSDEASGRTLALFRCTQMILWPK